MFLVKYNVTGHKLFLNVTGGKQTESVGGLVYDAWSDSVVMAGQIDGYQVAEGVFDGETALGNTDVLVLRFNASTGGRIWTRVIGAGQSEYATAIATDNAGSV